MRETPLYFKNGACDLFGILHEPAEAPALSAFVFCHPLGEEKLWTHRVFVSFARYLAARGHSVLRFDYMGNGDSDGKFSESSLATAQSDVRRAIAELAERTDCQKVTLLGLRWGATVASLVAETDPRVERLILWAPIVDGARYMQDLLRTNLTTQMAIYKEVRQDRAELVALMEQGATVNADGYDMAFPMYSQVSAIKLAAAKKEFSGPCLIVQLDSRTGKPSPELQQLSSTYGHATLLFVQEEPFWKEILRFYDRAPNLFAATAEWLG